MRILDIAKMALSFASGDQVDVLVHHNDYSLTRFANSYIHQNVKENNIDVTVRVVRDNRQGIAQTNIVAPDSLRDVAQKAGQIADLSPKDPVQIKLPKPAEYVATGKPDEATASLTPEVRADAVAQMVNYANPLGLTLAGAYSSGSGSLAIVNSNGLEAYNEFADAELKVTAMSEDSSGAAGFWTPRVSEISPLDIVKEAAGRAISSKKPVEIEPGEYEVVLLHYAVAELISMMNWTGISARAAEEGRSWLANNIGKKILSDKITIVDDPFDPRSSTRSFDFEGFPKSKMILVDKGVPVDVVYDSYYATKTGHKNTGHALPASSGAHPLALNVVVEGGTSTVDEMVSKIKKGVLVSRFWYTNIMRPLEQEFTGMTRDGLFLIENGKIVSGLKNMRVTDSIIRIFAGVEEVENVTRYHDGIVAPAMRSKGIIFSSKTKF